MSFEQTFTVFWLEIKTSGHLQTSPGFIQAINDVKSIEGTKVNLPNEAITGNGRVSGTLLNLRLTETLIFQESKNSPI